MAAPSARTKCTHSSTSSRWRSALGVSSSAGVTSGAAAARLGVEVQTIRRRVRAEQCPVVTIGRCKRIPDELIDGLFEKGWST